MRTWITLVSCAAVVAVTLSCAFPAIGQDYRTANAPMPTDRITQLENELAALKGTIQRASWSDGQYAGDGCCETDCRETGCGDALAVDAIVDAAVDAVSMPDSNSYS